MKIGRSYEEEFKRQWQSRNMLGKSYKQNNKMLRKKKWNRKKEIFPSSINPQLIIPIIWRDWRSKDSQARILKVTNGPMHKHLIPR